MPNIMQNRSLIISYTEYSSMDELDAMDKELVEEARKAVTQSYAPYSNFNVGAAVRMSDGRIFSGANQENSAYPSGLCAERTTMFYAHSHADGAKICSIAIAASQNGVFCPEPVSPCGACRQVMSEFQSESGINLNILLVGESRIFKFGKVEDLLPFMFDSLN